MVRASEVVQAELDKAVVSALQTLVEDADWNFTDALLEPALAYVRRCVADSCASEYRGFYASARGNGVTLTFNAFDENEELIATPEVDLFDILAGQFDGCARSEADIIFAAEHSLKRLRARFEERYGIPCEVDAIDADTRRQWPNVGYEPWKPGEEQIPNVQADGKAGA